MIDNKSDSQSMQSGKAKSWLGDYHWVSLPVTELNQDQDTITPAKEWCKTYFGNSGSRWFENKDKFYFRDEKDFSLFILNFCS